MILTVVLKRIQMNRIGSLIILVGVILLVSVMLIMDLYWMKRRMMGLVSTVLL